MTIEQKNYQEAMIETTMQAVSTALWAQDQADKLVRACLDSQQSTREEGRKLAEKMAEQVKANQESLQRFIHSSVSLSLASMRIPQPGQHRDIVAIALPRRLKLVCHRRYPGK